MAACRRLVVAAYLAAGSALVLRDAAEEEDSWPWPTRRQEKEDPGERKRQETEAEPPWPKTDIAMLLPLGDCSRREFWQGINSCLASVAGGAKEVGKTVSVRLVAGKDCDIAHEPLKYPSDVQVRVSRIASASSGVLLSAQLWEEKHFEELYDLLLVMGVDTGVEDSLLHRAQESLCGSVPQVVSVLRKFEEKERLRLLAPLGTLMTASTRTEEIMPAIRHSRFGEDPFCERMISKDRLARLERYAPSQQAAVAVAGGMYWTRHKALPHRVAELSQGLIKALGTDGPDARDAQTTVLEVFIPTQIKATGGLLAEIPMAPRPLAMYFPQYHPIPENDKFWGTNFTEWTLLRPFEGDQIRKPLSEKDGGLGYYDLRDKEVRRKQGQLARDHGIYGFVYYHYWFSSVEGHKVMHKVPELRILDGEPNMPFMLNWANEAWSRHWDGKEARDSMMLMQAYGEEDEWVAHFNYLLQFFKHPNYIRVEGKPAFAIYRPGLMHDKLEKMMTVWHALAKENGLAGLHIIATVGAFYREPDELPWQGTPTVEAAFHFLASNRCCWAKNEAPPAPPDKQVASTSFDSPEVKQQIQYWGAYVGFDNRPRRQGTKFAPRIKLSPGDFGTAVAISLNGMSKHPERNISDNLYFLASWNEWNEQCVMEPDDTYKFGFLEELKDKLRQMPVRYFSQP